MKATPAHLFTLGSRPVGRPDVRAAVPACVVPAAGNAAFLMYDSAASDGAAPHGAMLGGTLDGAALPRPMISATLELDSGRFRKLVLLRCPAPRLAAGHVQLTEGARRLAFVDPDWLQSPLRDLTDLVAGLAPEGRQRLFRLVLNGAPSVVGRAGALGLAQTIRNLLSLLNTATARLESRCPVGEASQILSYRLPGAAWAPPSALVALSGEQIQRLPSPSWQTEADGLLHVFLPLPVSETPDLVSPDGQVVLAAGSAGRSPRPFPSWLQPRPVQVRAWAEDLLRTAADSDPLAAAVLRDHSLGRAGRPLVEIALLASTRTGLLLWANVRDPYRLARTLRVERGGAVVDLAIPPSGLIRAHVALPKAGRGVAPCRLRLVHASGHVRTVREGLPQRFDGTLPVGLFDAPEAGRSLAEAWPHRFRHPPLVAVETVLAGEIPPQLCLMGPLPASWDMIRARAAMVAAEPDGTGVEIVYTVEGELSPAMRRLLSETAQVYGVAHRLVVFPESCCAADRLVAALGVRPDGPVLLLGADVLPQAPGWLPFWLTQLDRPGPVAIGGVLTGIDGAVEHAGGPYDWTGLDLPALARRRDRGLPACDLPATGLEATQLVSPDAVGLSAEAVRKVVLSGALSPDPEALLHLALHDTGACTAMGERFVRFGPPVAADPAVAQAGLWQVAAALCPQEA